MVFGPKFSSEFRDFIYLVNRKSEILEKFFTIKNTQKDSQNILTSNYITDVIYRIFLFK